MNGEVLSRQTKENDLDLEQRFGGERVHEYDRGIRKALPGYEALHDVAGSLLRSDLDERARLLVVGSGTGTEILGLGEHNPGWRFTGVDPSADMTAIARRRVEEEGLLNRVELRVGRTDDLPESLLYDAATSILVMHFLPDDGQKLGFLRSISARLKAGAPFILADLHGDEVSDGFARFLAAWRTRQLALGMAKQDVDEMFRDRVSNLVHFVPERRIVALMQEAGFQEIERFYGALLLGGWTARRSADA